MENLWNDVIPYWNEEFIEADETAARKTDYNGISCKFKRCCYYFSGVVAM